MSLLSPQARTHHLSPFPAESDRVPDRPDPGQSLAIACHATPGFPQNMLFFGVLHGQTPRFQTGQTPRFLAKHTGQTPRSRTSSTNQVLPPSTYRPVACAFLMVFRLKNDSTRPVIKGNGEGVAPNRLISLSLLANRGYDDSNRHTKTAQTSLRTPGASTAHAVLRWRSGPPGDTPDPLRLRRPLGPEGALTARQHRPEPS